MALEKIIAIFLLLFGCAKANDKPEPLDPADPVPAQYAAAVARVVAHLDGGFLVSRWDGGAPEHVGDSLIWTGMALGSLPCDQNGPVLAALTAMVDQLGGGLYRHPSLPDSISLDGALGLYWGVAHAAVRCPEARPALDYLMRKHQAFSEAADRLNPAGGKLPPDFAFVRDAAYSAVTGSSRPHSDRQGGFETQLTAWARGVKLKKAACFRVHLGLLSLQTMEAAGIAVSGLGRDGFCAATTGMDLPTVDHWCGRGDLAGWARDFKPNEWEYRHQRCGAWETPDGKAGLSTPGLDELVALRQVYDL